MNDTNETDVGWLRRRAGDQAYPDPGPTRVPIVRALAVASSTGILTANFVCGTLLVGGPQPNHADMGEWLDKLIDGDSTWLRLVTEMRSAEFSFAPNALVHLCDGLLPDENLIVPIASPTEASATTILRNFLIKPCLERLSLLRDIYSQAALEIVVRPGHSAWLQLGACIHFVKFRMDDLPTLSELRTSATGEFEFRKTRSLAANELAHRLSRLWHCNFDAILVEFEGVVRLMDVSINAHSERENTRSLVRLLDESDSFPETLDVLVANAAARVPTTLQTTSEPISHGQSQGDRCASGPLATSLLEAAQFASMGRPPVLVVDSLLPAAASGLERCCGLVLGRDGPASHISILARSLGLAVVSRVTGLKQNGQTSIAIGSTNLRKGDLLTVREEDGGVYQGAVSSAVSPVTAIAAWVDRLGDGPVALAIGADTSNLPTRRVGLCRSEMLIMGSPAADPFKAFLTRVAISKRPEPVPVEVQDRLRDCLADLLAASQGELTNYRLIDADLGEVLESRLGDAAPDTSAGVSLTVRGPRWALASGFYDWQLRMAIATAAAATFHGPVNLLITLPSAFSVEEVRAVRAMFDHHLLEHPQAQSSVRFGVMLETPRICETPTLLAESADAFCFGLNDLTSATFGLGRDVWPALGPYYSAAGLRAQDPFQTLDLVGVGALVKRTIRKLRENGAEGPILLCGEPAASEAAHKAFAGERNLYFSVGESDWARATLSCARAIGRLKGVVGFERSLAHERTAAALQQVIDARSIGRDLLAQESALRWIFEIYPLRHLPDTRNWKVLKKRLVASIFGAPEGRFFLTPWSPTEVARYVNSLSYPDRTTRVSAFSNHISCHARSDVVDSNWSEPELLAFLRSFDPNTTLNVFPQQQANQMCFRVVYSETGLVLEAGWGQAMYVFEAERGLHTVVSSQANSADALEANPDSAPEPLSSAYASFLSSHREWLQAMFDALPALLGSKQLAIEGYFNPNTGRIVIVDMDVPLDLAWNTAIV